ncbi:alpha/beta fold hydrolase [Streptomyces sp. NPDC088560]|uniref:alpha/beta fold hydrolase n=1 Tax=Streptomyces sp. NPDC088560 TaxID=3365868 RepID=UPI0038150A55
MLAYDIRGSGPGLVLLHGIGSTATATWGTLVDSLAAEYTLVLPDLPGSGLSPLPDGPLEAAAVADQIVATAREAGLSRFVVAGASLGAAIAIKIATRHPGRVRGLLTLAGFARPRTALSLGLEMWASLHTRQDDELSAFLASASFSEKYLAALAPDTARRLNARLGASATGTAEQIAFALGIDVRGDLSAVTAPTLVVAAMGDRFAAPEHSVELAEGIPGARLAAVRGGHAATIEEPGRILRVIREFLHDIDRYQAKGRRTAPAPPPVSQGPGLPPPIARPRNPHRR